MTKTEQLTLIVSILALVVSGLSFLDNHALVMPRLKVVSARSRPETTAPLNVPIWVTLRNEGHLDAIVTEIDATPFSTVLLDEQDTCNRDLQHAETTPTRDFGRLGEIGKDHVSYINPYIHLPKSCSSIPPQIGVAIVMKYHDFLHIPYSQNESIRATLEKDPVSIPPSGR